MIMMVFMTHVITTGVSIGKCSTTLKLIVREIVLTSSIITFSELGNITESMTSISIPNPLLHGLLPTQPFSLHMIFTTILVLVIEDFTPSIGARQVSDLGNTLVSISIYLLLNYSLPFKPSLRKSKVEFQNNTTTILS